MNDSSRNRSFPGRYLSNKFEIQFLIVFLYFNYTSLLRLLSDFLIESGSIFVIRDSLFVVREGVPLMRHIFLWGLCTGFFIESFVRFLD